ncbi:MAG: response regulator, partial [Leptospiraceae bacterium]|nr:response regulator [Leptospiraceae bacterium]
MSLEKFKEAKILIVDDEPTNLRVLYNLLKEYQFKLFTIQDSTTVIETLVQNIPDLILLDIMMPGINGFELCKQIKEKEELSNIPIIFISALNDTKNILKGFELGGNDYISKPFQSEEVLARIKNQLTIKYQAKFLEEKNKELTELNSMKNKFFSIIAHDVRNPFSAILGLSEILQDDFDNLEKEQMKSMVGHIHNSTNKCYKLLENLLQWANSQLNKVEVSPVNNNLLNHVNKVLEIFQMQAENKKITLSQ